ncbi:MAG: fibronectin type III domain-containing protein [Lachnospiraceae bacterium]
MGKEFSNSFTNIITSEQARTKSTYTDAGWDFDKIWDIDTTGYYDKIYVQNETLPEGVEIQYDEIGPFYYDTELKYINDGYPYLRSDMPDPPIGNAQLCAVTVSVVFPDAEIGYYAPATIDPEITITGIEGVENANLEEMVQKYDLKFSYPSAKQYMVSSETTGEPLPVGGSLDTVKKNLKFAYDKNDEYSFYIDYDNSTIILGQTRALPNPYQNLSNEEKAEALLKLGIERDKSDLDRILTSIEQGEASQNSITYGLCWAVLDLTRYDKVQHDPEIDRLLDRWFAAEKEAYKEMYTENQEMNGELTTVWQRELIAITAAGYDPEDIRECTKGIHGEDDPGFDLVEAVGNEVGADGAHMHYNFWLIALDSGDYPSRSTHEADVEKRAEMLYNVVKSGVCGAAPGIGMDYVGMHSQALTKYIHPEKGTIYYEVAEIVNEKLKAEGELTIDELADKDRMIPLVKKYQCPLGGWITYDNYNPATTAQAVTMLSCLGIDAYSEELTTNAGYSMLDSFIQSAFNLDENGLPVSFKDSYEMTVNCAFYSAQSIYATISWYRLMNGQTALYDCTDVVGVPQVEAMIEALPSDITLNEVKAVEEAKAAYDALRDGQKQYIDNYDLLKAAAEKADALKAAAEEEEAFKALKSQLTAAAAGYNSVKLSWKAADGAEGYEVYRATSKNGSYKLVKTITSGKTVTYTDGKLNTGTTYYYKVRAYRKVESSKAYSSYSDIKSAKPVPAAPSLTAKAAGYSSVKLSWKKVDGAEGYRVYRATSKNGTYKAVKTITSGSTVTYTDGKLNTGTTYYYKVRAYRKVESSNVYGSYSDIKSAKPVLAAPSLTAKAAGYNSVKLSWKKADGAEGYRVYRATSKNGTYKAVKTITSGTTVTYTDEKLTTGKTYYYKVRAYRKVGSSNIYSGYSDIKSAKPVPAKATLTSVKNVSGKKAVLSWKAVNGASGYRIYRADTKNGTYKYVKDITSGKTLTWTNSGLTKGKTCYYKIRAYRTVNGTRVYGAYSDVKTVKISK